jgi:hypothetical protein
MAVSLFFSYSFLATKRTLQLGNADLVVFVQGIQCLTRIPAILTKMMYFWQFDTK